MGVGTGTVKLVTTGIAIVPAAVVGLFARGIPGLVTMPADAVKSIWGLNPAVEPAFDPKKYVPEQWAGGKGEGVVDINKLQGTERGSAAIKSMWNELTGGGSTFFGWAKTKMENGYNRLTGFAIKHPALAIVGVAAVGLLIASRFFGSKEEPVAQMNEVDAQLLNKSAKDRYVAAYAEQKKALERKDHEDQKTAEVGPGAGINYRTDHAAKLGYTPEKTAAANVQLSQQAAQSQSAAI